ncbi:MAG: OpgC domain-containing protein [Alphaproteobacteria bacterium]
MADPYEPARRNRLIDIFRGLAFLFIFLAHTPGNDWKQFIPGAWGFSDATEVFVFVSGMAAGFAFVPAFGRAGFGIGTLRIARRMWQVYLAHLMMFFAIAALLTVADLTAGGTTHVDFLNLRPFFDDPQTNLVGLLSLTYVPNLFDILPMYVVILALVPPLVALARLHPTAALGASACLYAVAAIGRVNLPAEPWSDRGWFFDPLCWQLLFTIGMALSAGWLPRPRLPRWLAWAALGFVLVSVPVANFDLRTGTPLLEDIYAALEPVDSKTFLGPLRILHFLALAIAVIGLAGPRLAATGNRVAVWLERIGQQSLIVFVSSTILAQVAGVLIFEIANTWATTLVATVAGFVAIYAVARLAARTKAALEQVTLARAAARGQLPAAAPAEVRPSRRRPAGGSSG